jgi:predicted phage terminase large subunit-like protein
MTNLSHLPEGEMKEILMLQERLSLLETQDKAKDSFMEYIRYIWPGFIEGDHHRIIADKLTRVAKGELKRLIVNMPPRHTKSEFASIYFPSWVMGLNPDMKIMQTTHTADLSINFGRKVRNLMDTDEYSNIFPKVSLASDSKSAGKWQTSQGGEYFAAGVGGAIAGRGADLLIIDDPHSEQDAMSINLLDSCYEWYTSGPRQRLQPGGAIVIVMTRWSTADLTGRLLTRQTETHSDQWEVVELPAIFEDSGNVLWPEFWKREELDAVKASIPVSKWNAQYQQNPTSEEGAIIKRDWWQLWEHDEPPICHYVIQSYDTAFSKKETADYSAITTWGVFRPTDQSHADMPPGGDAIVLLDAQKGRWDFPELKAVAQEQYAEYQPDMVLIEAQASGTPLTHELRAMGIPVVNYRPSRGNDKMTRVHAVSPVFEAGMVWAPDRVFAEEVIEECAAFPFAPNDDYVDTTTQAILRFREGNFINLYSDEDEDEVYREKRAYY